VRSKTKADETDAKILRRLLEDSRASFTSIAKECKISVNAVRVRYERLKKAGIIKGATIEVNPYSFGFRCITDVGIITNTENEESIQEELGLKKYILVAKRMGKYNIMALVVSSSTEEISDIVQHMESDPRIIRTDTFLWTNPTNIIHPENLVFKTLQPNNQAQVTKKQTELKIDQPQIDETDINIAKMLVQDSRKPFQKIGEQLGISTNMVIKRYNKLKETNVITHSIKVK
jgi:Lrp/AsnC family transcriptional regulator, regulator for asnA, asnC and gidA